LYFSVAGLFNLAKQHRSRAGDARVQSTLSLIKAIPSTSRTRVGKLTRTLTPTQYGALLRAVEDSGDVKLQEYFTEKLRYSLLPDRPGLWSMGNMCVADGRGNRFDYTGQKKRLEIRMPTSFHDEVGDYIMDQIKYWARDLTKSTNTKTAAAAKGIVSSGHADIEFSYASAGKDKKSPDGSIRHRRRDRKCKFPNIVKEIGWSQNPGDLREKAEAYSE
jgi:hypothetical protein